MKVTFYVVIFMIVFGVADLILNEVGMEGPNIAMYDKDQVTDSLNGTAIVEAWNPSLNIFFDIGAGLKYFWNTLSGVIRAFPATLSAYGAPDSIVAAVNILYALATTGMVIEFISGKEFMP